MIGLKPISGEDLKYDHIVGTGGIGSGIFFSLDSIHTLGRNESRMGTLLPCKDFCKQHIILHYISILLGASINGSFRSFPIGKVGNDDIGKKLLQNMEAVGMDTGNIGIDENHSTLFSVCFQYPDHTGGNITTANSASGRVSPADIANFFQEFSLSGNTEIILAAPEVPLAARIKLLEYGRQRGSLNVASILSSEADAFRQFLGFTMVDVLAINIDEARSISKMNDESFPVHAVIDTCVKHLVKINPAMAILITDGSNGSYCFKENYLEYTPALMAPVNSTAGAGDAFLAGTIAGLACGLPLVKRRSDKYFSESPLQSAVELGTLLASLSVTSPDTIHLKADASSLYSFARNNNIIFSADFLKLFENQNQYEL